MEKDVVCGMPVIKIIAAGKSEYQGKLYYFCSKRCKTLFDKNPEVRERATQPPRGTSALVRKLYPRSVCL